MQLVGQLLMQFNIFVRHPDGTQSVLKVGAHLNVGDVVVTSPGAHAEIQVAEGQLIKIGSAAGDALTIDKSILDTPADHHDVKADAATDFNKIIENLAKGNDIGDNLDPTAAGNTGGGDLMSGNVYVVVEPIVTTTTPSPFENANSLGGPVENAMFSLLLAPQEINLNDNAPIFVDSEDSKVDSYTFTYDENRPADTVLGTVKATDADVGDTVTYSITAGDPNGYYAINATTGEITLTAAGSTALVNDFETLANTRDITVTATDTGSVHSTDIQVTLTELNLNDQYIIVGSDGNDANPNTQPHTVDPTTNTQGNIIGGTGADVLIGDPGGSILVKGQSANIAFVLDISGSMSTSIPFGGGSISRLAALKLSVIAELTSLKATGADVTVHINKFSTTATNVGIGTFHLNILSEFNAAVAAVQAITSGGNTNYEAGLQGSLDWINSLSTSAITSATMNKVIFISDGQPNTLDQNATGGAETTTTASSTAQQAIDSVLGTLAGSGSIKTDHVSEVGSIALKGFTLQAIGINVGSAALGYLTQLQAAGSATNITTTEGLTAAIGSLTGSSVSLATAGNDTIITGITGLGHNIVFGDSVNTDLLASSLNLGTLPGFGYGVFQTLETTSNSTILTNLLLTPYEANFGTWTAQDTYNYIQTHYLALALESGRSSGNDIIDASATGNNIIFGQEGNDTITVGAGTDLISGGSGTDTFIFNSGASQAVIAGTGSGATLSGFDVISDYQLGAVSGHNELLSLPGTVAVAANTAGVDGNNTTAYGIPIGSHTIVNGVISFFSDNNHSTTVTIDSNAKLASALDYLTHNDIGGVGATVVLTTATGDSYVYSQGAAGSGGTATTNYTFVELQHFAATGLTTNILDTNLQHILIS